MFNGLKYVWPFRGMRRADIGMPFTVLFKKFTSILERNNRILEEMADTGDKLSGEYVFDRQYLVDASDRLTDQVFKLISDFSLLDNRKNADLFLAFERIRQQIREELAGHPAFALGSLVIPLFEASQDLRERGGGKMAVLSEIHNRLQLNTPDGFVITTKAFMDLMAHNGLLARVQEGFAGLSRQDPEGLKGLVEQIQQNIQAATIPPALAARIDAQLDILARHYPHRPLALALRSSAWGEDEESSFAGQYTSVLNVPRSRVLEAYRRVLASLYSLEAWQYRLDHDYREHETAMAVGCQMMATGTVSGVVQTYADLSDQPAILVASVRGLGAAVVGGDAPADTFYLARTPPYQLIRQELAEKTRQLIAVPGGGTAWEPVPDDLRQTASLTPPQLEALAQQAMAIECYYKRPQNIEWTFTDEGEPVILQAGPLRLQAAAPNSEPAVIDTTARASIVFAERGLVAQRGVAVGKVVVVRNDTDLERFPYGGILVSRYTSPRFSRVMHKARGIITDVGSPAGHMATVAREYRIPTVVNTQIATQRLNDGDEITLDATGNVVYRGNIANLDRFELTEEIVFEESYEYRLLRRLLKRISAFHLVDPKSANFTASACRTYHDITRYIHEKSVETLIRLSDEIGVGHSSAPRRLSTKVPLGLTVIDAGGGIAGSPTTGAITRDQVVSLPLGALLDGIDESAMWGTQPLSVDMGSFMSSLTRTFTASLAAPQKMGRNLAVVLEAYLNLHLRIGYHFTIIDAYMSDRINDNMIHFRFLGGVTDFLRRSRRAKFVAAVLEHFDFRVDVRGDLVIARIKKLPLARMTSRMRMLGGLIGYTRQLDARMHSDNEIARHVKLFTNAIGKAIGGSNE